MCYKLPLPEYPGSRPRCYDQTTMELQERVIPLMTVTEAAAVKIKQLIATEDPKHPFSDQKIVELLREQTIDIARRTVAKYRTELNILPSNLRKVY